MTSSAQDTWEVRRASDPAPIGSNNKKFLSYATLAILALVGAACNLLLLQQQPEVRGLEVLETANPVFDDVDPTKPLDHSFQLYNPTSRPIRIQDVSTGCTCTTTKLNDYIVEPGKTVRLNVQINKFKSFTAGFAEPAFVKTDDGQLELWLSGSFKPLAQVLHYPPALYIEPGADGRLPSRTIHVKVPNACVSPREKWILRLNGPIEGDAQVVDDNPSPLYREITVRLTVRVPDVARSVEGALSINAGCSGIDIPITIKK